MASLLAVDLGLKCGLALFGDDGRLRWYRSHNFGARNRMRRGAYAILADIEDVEYCVIEGGGELEEPWVQACRRLDVTLLRMSAQDWRSRLLPPRDQTSGAKAKEAADGRARAVIAWSGAKKPTSLRHDAAEAVLTGLAAVIDLEWLTESLDDVFRQKS